MKEDIDEAPGRASVMGRGSGGRQKLIDAALELASTTRSLASLGLREVTRCAGLAPNAFYRHFKDFDDLGLAAVDMMGGELRRGLRERRQRLARNRKGPVLGGPGVVSDTGRQSISETVGLVLDFVTEHPTAYVVGIRELNGSSPKMRAAVRKLLDDFARDMAEDIQQMLDAPVTDEASMQEIARQVIHQMTFFSMEYLEQPQRRKEIREQAERFIMRMFAGEMALAMAGKKKVTAKKLGEPRSPVAASAGTPKN
ncbi:TetR family transcriptional regulator [Solimonas sp. K1W22B-7]|uniref:TetR family transcriptional regulator n=1 Tax=Solimonas sp. K1W22B-7 TaxID=2303331 RepID=UPI0013C50218|nr:TetR family transcriptional regulator [Solimonas sp. K1W22B-7]